MLLKDDGSWVSKQSKIGELVQHHFKTILTSSTSDENSSTDPIDLVFRELHLPSITDNDCSCLLRPFTPDEIKESFFSLADHKSPRLDGYNV